MLHRCFGQVLAFGDLKLSKLAGMRSLNACLGEEPERP